MRAVKPVHSGSVDRDGVAIHYEVYGDGEPTVYLLMPDVIVQSEAWKAQVPFLARVCRVIVSDPRGNGLSDTPTTAEEYSDRVMLDDQWAVMDAVGADQAVLVGLCTGAGHALLMAAERPDRVIGVCAINPGLLLSSPLPHKVAFDFEEPRDSYEGWQKRNRNYWLSDWPDFAQFFFAEMLPEPHSTKQIEDCVDWALTAGAQSVLLEGDAPRLADDLESAAAECRAVRCPVLVITGSLDNCQNPERGLRVAELTGGDLVVIEGGGHLPQARDPVKVNLLLRDFVRRVAPASPYAVGVRA